MRPLALFCTLLGFCAALLLWPPSCLGQAKSALGESCEKTDDCERGLVCTNLTCVKKLDSVKSCKKTADCSNGLRCIEQKCVRRDAFGAWRDPISGLTWQNPPPQSRYNLKDALAYCSKLQLGGNSDWRLPTISELRSLVRRCPATQTGGTCRVTDSCRSLAPCHDDCRIFCPPRKGHCYWPSQLQGKCLLAYWSSSFVEGSDALAWQVNFFDGYVNSWGSYVSKLVRCVR